MKYSDDLFQLIQSLSQSEKRYVKLYAQAFSIKGTDKQLALLQAFENQNEYNEELIRQAFEARISPHNFHVAKNRLYNLILRALQLFHAKDSVQERLHQYLSQGNILKNKNLFVQAQGLFEKALQLAQEHDQPALAFMAESALHELRLELKDLKALQLAEEPSRQRRNTLLQNLQQASEFQDIENQIFKLTHRYQWARSQEQLQALQRLENHPLLHQTQSQQLQSPKHLLRYYELQTFLASFQGQSQKAFNLGQQIFQLSHTEYSQAQRKTLPQYLRRLDQQLFLALQAHQFETAENLAIEIWELQQLSFVLKDPLTQLKIAQPCLHFWLEYFLMQNRFEEALTFVEQHLNYWPEILKQTHALRCLNLLLYLCQTYLSHGQVETAAHYLDRCLNHPEIKSYEHLFAGAMTMNLLLHFELQNYQLLESLVVNTYRTMRKRKLLYQSEKVLLRYLRRLLRPKDETERNDLFCRLKRELKRGKKHNFEAHFLQTFDLSVWLESKRSRMNMADYLGQGGEGFFPTCSS